MNFERFDFQEMCLESLEVRDVLRCLLHSVLFNRAMGAVAPRDAECTSMNNVAYAKINDPAIEDAVEGFIDRFLKSWHKSGSSKAQVCLGFYERSVKKSVWFGGSKEEKTFWERWLIPLSFVSDKPSAKTAHAREEEHAARAARLVENLLYLVRCVNEKKEHLPPSKSASALPFHFELSFTTGDKSEESWGMSTLKRMLKQGPPMLLS